MKKQLSKTEYKDKNELYEMEYINQYETKYNMHKYIKTLVKRRKNFSELCTEQGVNFGTIYFQDNFKSQRLFDANYLMCKIEEYRVDDSKGKTSSTDNQKASISENILKACDIVIKCEEGSEDMHYVTCISVFGSTSSYNKKVEQFFEAIMFLHNKLSPKQGVIFLTEGCNTFTNHMLGNIAFKRQTFSDNEHQSKNSTYHISPLVKIIGVVELDNDMRKILDNKKEKFQPKRMEMEVMSHFTSIENINQIMSSADSTIKLNPDHTEFIFIENENQSSQLTYVHRYHLHEKIFKNISDTCNKSKKKCNPSQSEQKPEICCSMCPCMNKKNKIDVNDQLMPSDKKVNSILIVIGGDENKDCGIVDGIIAALKNSGHFILCKNTGGIADELAQIYIDQKQKQDKNQNKKSNKDNEDEPKKEDSEEIENKDKNESYRKKLLELCNTLLSKKTADNITVIEFLSTDQFLTQVCYIFFSLFKNELKDLNLITDEYATQIFKDNLKKQDSADDYNTDEIVEANDTNITLKNFLSKDMWNFNVKNISNDPFEKLFIWATVTGRDSLGIIFLGRCQNIILLSLLAAYLYRLKRKQLPFYSENTKRQLKQLKERYEDIAIGIIDLVYVALNQRDDLFFTIQKTYEFSCTNIIEVAALAKCKRVLKTDAFGDMMFNMWHGEKYYLSRNPNSLLFEKTYSAQFQIDTNETLAKKFASFLRCHVISNKVAPRTKFYINLTVFVIFLIYYVVVLLLLYQGKSNALLEGVIFTWVIGLVFEEIFEIIHVGSFRNYFGKSRYNIIDVVIILIGLIAFYTSLDKARLFDFAKYFYWFNGILLIFRLFREFAAFKSLGPKLTMIFIMMKQLGEFSFILIAVLTLFGISYSLFPSTDEEISFVKPFFLINQMIYEFEDVSKAQQVCFTNNTSDIKSSNESCAAFVFKFITSASFIYVVNLMVINFIIALFSSAYDIYTLKSESV